MEENRLGPIVLEIARGLGVLGPPHLLRTGTNQVFAVGPVVVRLAPAGVAVEGARQVAVAHVLRRHGVPVPEPLAAGELDGHHYTVWERVAARSEAGVDYHRFGTAIGVLHAIDPGELAAHGLPWCDEAAWLDFERNLERAAVAGVVSADDLALLRDRATDLRRWGDQCRATGPTVVCHGDVHPQNVLMDAGRVVVVDWDTICLGPPQWDHAALLTWADRWGGDPGDYPAFVRGYGRSFEGDPLARMLAGVRLLAPTINLIARAGAEPRLAGEARLRMAFWRRPLDAPAWTPQ